MAWKKGPLPKDTFNWGAVVPYEKASGEPWPKDGFMFASFEGDKARLTDDRVLKAHEVKYYDNSIEMPPTE